MKKTCFTGYIRYHIKWLFAVLFCGMVMTVIMILNHIPNEEILYGMLLCMVLWFVITVVDYIGYRKRFLKLQELETSVTVSLERMPQTGEPLEHQYQELLLKLLDAKKNLENEALHKQRNLTEYYTMWVHQIKTPIAALKLLLAEDSEAECDTKTAVSDSEEKLLLEQKSREERRQERQQEVFRIEQYVEMALQYMRLEAESTDFVFAQVELDTVIRESVRKYARQFIRKKISLDYEGVNTVVLTDEKWLEFVIGQLLSNALKYTPKGSIAIRMEEEKLVIADTGIGIRSEDLPRVCEKGYTGYNGHADKRSTGIGLYLCSRVLRKLGHSFAIESVEGCGTVVKIGFEEMDNK